MSTTMTDPRRSSWIPWVFVGGMLLVVAVNAVLVVASVTTFTGVTVPGAYDRGRAYNQVLAEAARQDALGWEAEVSAGRGLLRVAVRDREGFPVPGRIEGVLRAPVEGTDLPIFLVPVASGAWQAVLQAPRAGQWQVRLTVTGATGERLEIRRKVVLP